MQDRPRKYLHFVHSPFTLSHDGIKVECNEDGKIKILNGETEIQCPSALINRINHMIVTAKEHEIELDFNDKGEFVLIQKGNEIECPDDLFLSVSRMILTTRKKVWKDYPYGGGD